MKLPAKIHKFGIKMMLVVTLLSVAACDDVIYDYEGDCSVNYRLRFCYDMNMAFADAFAHEVNSVSVYAFDSKGVLAWQNTEQGEVLKADDYSMPLNLPAGKYDLIAWCGLENDVAEEESFGVTSMQEGVSTKAQLLCRLNRKHTTDGLAYTDEDLYRLYHGELAVEIMDENAPEAVPGTHDVTMNLVKNTNRVRIILQQLSGKGVEASDFSFAIEEENGLMNYDNSLLSDEMIHYRNWQSFTGSAGVENPEDGVISEVSVAIADITVGRMIDGRKMMLTITNSKENKVVARVPVIDYALLVKDNYETEMSNQEYLDRQDQFSMTFFIDEDKEWISSVIYVNSWRVVLNETDL